MENLLNLFIIIIEVLCLKNFVEIYKKRVNRQNVNVISEIILISAIYTLDILFGSIVFIKMLSVALVIVIYLVFVYDVKIVHAMFISMAFLCMLTFLDVVVWMVFKNLLVQHIKLDQSDAINVYYVTLLIRAIAIFMIMYARRKIFNIETEYFTDGKDWLKYMYFPFMTIVIIVGVLVYCDENVLHNTVVIIMVSLLAIMNFIVFSIVESVVRYEKRLSENQILERDMKSRHEYYQYVSENYDKQRQEIHEFKNQMECILEMLYNKEYDKTEKFVRNITVDLSEKTDCVDTKNAIINVVLNQKYRIALKKNILMVFELQELSDVYLKDTDIVTILSNLIDNALESCEKCKDKKIINVKIRIDNAGNFIIRVKNTVPLEYKFNKNNIISTKKDKRKHGYGIKNIIRIVEKNQGHCNIECNNEQFIFSIIIPIKE